MSETDKVVAEILTKAMEATRVAGNFVVEQAPDVIQQLLTIHLAYALLGVVCGVLFLAGFFWLAVFAPFDKLYVAQEEYMANDNERYGGVKRQKKDRLETRCYGGVIAGIISGGIGAGILIENVPVALKIYFAPKVYLLEYAASLVK